ncbi:MAG: mechanosensitive ion channel [Limnospira sp.]
MIETWCTIPPLMGIGIPTLSHLSLAQETNTGNPIGNLTSSWGFPGTSLVDLGIAVGILFLGWLLALFAGSVTKNLLKKTDLDNRLANWVGGSREDGESLPIEKWAGSAVFWIILIFAIIGFLDRLQLTSASAPLSNLLNEITSYIPKILGAVGLLALAWILATICRALTIRVLDLFKIDERLTAQVGETADTQNQFSLSHTLANAVYWFIFLLFLPMILSALQLSGLLAPVELMIGQILSSLPNILKALLIVAGGWLLAQIVSRIVTNLLAAVGFDRFGSRFGLQQTMGNTSLSSIAGTIVYVLILIPIAISALEALQIEAISNPAISMLEQIFDIIPQIFISGVILAVAYIVGMFVRDLVANLLTNIGFNNVFVWLGLQPQSPPTPPQEAAEPEADLPLKAQSPKQSPSEIVGIVAFVGIMLFAVVTATDILQLTALTLIIEQLIIIAGRVLFAAVIFAIGLYFANLAFSLISSSGNSQAKLLAQGARIAIIIFVGAMALQQMGIASNIVNLAFGLLLGAIAVAIAIAFGLGGRDVAAEQIREVISRFRQ